MPTFENKKLQVTWRPYHGFSLLFDNPGPVAQTLATQTVKTGNTWQVMACNIRIPGLELYSALDDSLNMIGSRVLKYDCHLYRLPTESYHVTVWDGVNNGNVARISSAHRPPFQSFLDALPDEICEFPSQPFYPTVGTSTLVTRKRRITFEFDRLTTFGGAAVLAARLKPVKASRTAFTNLKRSRTSLNNKFARRYGHKTAHSGYTPHVTLGYFSHKAAAAVVTSAQKNAWTSLFAMLARGKTITFESISLYGFTDMATFIK
jgi:hypothetical protein